MTLDELIKLLSKVLVSPEVIGVTIVAILYISIANYVVYYRKKVPVPRTKKKKAAPVSAGADESGDESASERASKRGKKDSSPSEDDE